MNQPLQDINNNEKSRINGQLNYYAQTLHGAELHKAYKLRHKVYAEELGWVKTTENRLEIDNYETDSTTFGVFNNEHKLLATLRLIPHQRQYMLESDFSNLVSPDHTILKTPETAEITRLCIDQEHRNVYCDYPFGKSTFSLLLYHSLYKYCKENNIRFLYMVVEYKVLRLLCLLGFPCQKIGDPVKMPDGVSAVAAILDWREFERINVTKKPAMLKWFIANNTNPQISKIPLDKATATA